MLNYVILLALRYKINAKFVHKLQILRNTAIPETPMYKPEFPPQGLSFFLHLFILTSRLTIIVYYYVPASHIDYALCLDEKLDSCLKFKK